MHKMMKCILKYILNLIYLKVIIVFSVLPIAEDSNLVFVLIN